MQNTAQSEPQKEIVSPIYQEPRRTILEGERGMIMSSHGTGTSKQYPQYSHENN